MIKIPRTNLSWPHKIHGKISSCTLSGLWQCPWVPLLVSVGLRVAARGHRDTGSALQDLPGRKGCAGELGEQSAVFGVCLGLTFQYYSFRRMLQGTANPSLNRQIIFVFNLCLSSLPFSSSLPNPNLPAASLSAPNNGEGSQGT